MADLTRREKVYESVVHARIDACYLRPREFARSHGYRLDFEDTTLFQVFIGDPVWSLVAAISDQDGTAALVNQARQAAPDYVEAVWLGILGRFRSLNLVATHRIASSQSQPI
ncbi:MAG: hypothetical protein FJ312_05385 [SAR202 cluster bacterium]|nr:hypothetical protein [SAR202 cluster bacterium]